MNTTLLDPELIIYQGQSPSCDGDCGVVSQTDTSIVENWLFLTRACNMRCPYCYVNKDARTMREDIGLATLDRIFKSIDLTRPGIVKIKYAGGEPTLVWNLFQKLHEEAKFLAASVGTKLEEVIITNAIGLTESRLQYLKQEKIRLSISIDGFGDGHDVHRRRIDGKSTTEQVKKTILQAIRLGHPPFLITTLTKYNLDEVPKLIEFALSHRLKLNLGFYRAHSPSDPLVPTTQALVKALTAGLEVVKATPPNYGFLEGLIDRSHFGFAHKYPCGAGKTYNSIDTDGSMYPCHMLAGRELFPTQQFGELTSLETLIFENPSVDEKEGCMNCIWRYWCGGGCPVLSISAAGSARVPSPYCEVYLEIYPELVSIGNFQLSA